mgnify:CR=1 FL=1
MEDLIPLNETLSVSKMKINENNDKNNSGVLATLEGPFAEIESVNRNNRVYSKELWESVINSDYVQEMLGNKTLFGEADHPEDRFEISLPDISHVITDLWIDESNNQVMGKLDILDTPAGQILYTVCEYGSQIGISARAAGSLKEENGVKRVVEDDYTFFTFDTVPNPGFGTTRLERSDKGSKIAASNDRIEEDDDIDIESMKEDLVEKIEKAKKDNLDIMKSVVESVGFNKKNYKEFIDIIEERKKENIETGENDDSTLQENTYSLLEESQKKVYQLEEEKEELEDRVSKLKDEVNRLSEKEERGNSLFDEDIYKEELDDSRERINKLEGLVKELRNKLNNAENNDKVNEEVENEIEDKILRLEREKKSKKVYAELLENRIENISESKVDIEKDIKELNEEKEEVIEERDKLVDYIEKIEEKNKELEESLDELSNRNVELEEYIVDRKSVV